ncbi:hybrid sensor histidine kinase/response regulator [Pedobacter yulinensis]|uniref:histidine kinase n=1 Tax=Pedobacter yulinensis TaxID=2126353 RepID=A0A2T3HMC6_9SPHI|nr:ATP-binding protein [Pedobacter yulinensis]PST83521.1 hybrid sensor histidine kinase/response regulator [Pedobacter yulinensis]
MKKESTPQKSLIDAVKGKVIIGFLLACIALFTAWGVSKGAFNEILSTVDNISSPNEKLRLVNDLSLRIANLDQSQKRKAYNAPGNYSRFFTESKLLRLKLDTLNRLYANDTVQLARFQSIEKLLAARDKQFLDYLKVREGMVNNKAIASQLQRLNELVDQGARLSDTTIVATERTTSTTTLVPVEKERKGFLNKLFGKKRAGEEPGEPQSVTNEQFNVKLDTIALARQDSLTRSLENSLRIIEREQKAKSKRFLDREAELAEANGQLINRMLNILGQVEKQVVEQINQNVRKAQQTVNGSVDRITLIILSFFVLTGILLYFILSDIVRSNRYRRELEKAKEEAEQYGMAKQRFLSNMSHEIRTPLQSIIGFSKLIGEQEKPERRHIEAIHHSSEHLLQIVNEVLDYNRIVSGELTFSEQVFSMPQLLDEVLAAMRPHAEAKSLSLAATYDLHEVEFVKGDPFRLKQVLFNLLGNAVKFTMQGSITLAVSCKTQAEELHFSFSVRDTGIGFDEADSIRIFREFEQVEMPEKSIINQTGTGLGLVISKSIVESLGGRIYARSRPGAGSTFVFYLTYMRAERPAATDEQQVRRFNYPFKVWIADDDALIVDLCSLIFKKHGIAFQAFTSPLAMLEATLTPDVRYILLDIRMPGMSGLELCSHMRQRVAAGVSIFAITAQVLPDERQKVIDQGFDGILTKPFREEELLAMLQGNAAPAEPPVNMIADTPEVRPPDLSRLEKMTFGDARQMSRILHRFVTDTESDLVALSAALRSDDSDKVHGLVHKLAGRTGQIGAGDIAADLREMEAALYAASGLRPGDAPAIEQLADRLLLVVAQIRRMDVYTQAVS